MLPNQENIGVESRTEFFNTIDPKRTFVTKPASRRDRRRSRASRLAVTCSGDLLHSAVARRLDRNIRPG
jgi:hypothetical protein